MTSKISLVIRREYLERVRKKSFIITTILMPLVMIALMVTPALIMIFSEGSTTRISVVDKSGVIAPELKNTGVVLFSATDSTVEAAHARDSIDAVLLIPANILETGAGVQLYSDNASSMSVESEITSQINEVLEHLRISNYNIENFDEILDKVKADVEIQSFRFDEDNEAKQASTALSYGLGIVLTMLLYMCMLLYGQMVMTSIIEEKNNRVLEIVVSSVKPTQLMLGKICGIGLVAVTQIIIWGVLMTAMAAFVMPALLPDAIASDMAAAASGTADMSTLTTDSSLVSALLMLGNVGYIIKLFALLLIFLVCGFMLYAAIYAAIGSAVDNIQDAGQLQSVVLVPILIGIMVAMAAASDPSSQLSFWTSMIPFTSPMVMMARIPFGIPGWEIALSLIILVLSFLAMVWLAAKIYRVGIFMYGKKPTISELIRWARYK